MKVGLRQSARVDFDDEKVVVNHALWSISISTKRLKEFPFSYLLLTSESSEVQYTNEDSFLVALRVQGCLTFPDQDHYSNIEALEIFNGASLLWYHKYYSHKLWSRLRAGEATKSELISWILHNYHVSLNAGVTHARIADRDPLMAPNHRRCAKEEYWHADKFYFAQYDGLSSQVVKDYVPLPSSYAFQIHLRQLARQQPIAYKLVSYFQERTIIFADNAELFYDQVEDSYKMPGLFKGWREHLKIDQELNHFDERRHILLLDKAISGDHLRREIHQARIAFEILISCLDDIEHEGRSGNNYSARVFNDSVTVASEISSNLSAISVIFKRGLHEFLRWLSSQVHLCDARNKWIQHQLVGPAFTALSHARSHDDIMIMGRIASYFDSHNTFNYEPTLGEISFVNHLSELSLSDRDDFLAAILATVGLGIIPESETIDICRSIYSKLANSEFRLTRVSLVVFQCIELLSVKSLARVMTEENPNTC
jgi:hypothetical protein